MDEEIRSQIAICLSIARALDDAEERLEEAKEAFNSASDHIKKIIGWELWHTDARGGKFFWKRKDIDSQKFDSRTEAIRAMLDGTVVFDTR